MTKNESKTWSIEHEGPLNKGNIVFKNSLIKKSNELNDMWVCGYCGSEEVQEQVWKDMNTKKIITANDYYQCANCEEECTPMKHFDWTEKIAEECMGNKDKYDKIIDGSRA